MPVEVKGMANGSYPARLGIEAPLEVKNWRPLVHWLLAIPHYLILYALSILRRVLLLIAFFTVLFTKKIPQQMFDLIVMTRRYGWRVGTYAVWMRESYPPFSFGSTALDDGMDPAWLSTDYPQELNRWGPLFKWLLAIPHYIVLLFLRIAVFFVVLVSFFAVLFTGKWPKGMRSFVVGVSRWSLRVVTYAAFLTDEYPPFSLEDGSPGREPAVSTGGPPPQALVGEPIVPPPPPPTG